MMGHGHGPPPSAGTPGLPFAGIPPEMADRAEALARDEPDFSHIDVPFTHRVETGESFTLWRFLAPYKFRMLGALALVGLTEMLLLVGPYLIKVAIDEAILPQQFDRLVMIGGLWAGSLVVAVIINGIRIRYVGRMGQLLLYELRVRVFGHLQRLSLDFYTEEKAGRLLTRMTSDIEALSQLLQTGLVNLVSQGLALCFIIAILFSFNVQLTLILLLIAAPIMVGMTAWFRVVSERGYENVRNRIADVLADLSESLAGIKLIAAFNRMRHNVIHHRNVVGDYREANNFTARINAGYRSGTMFVDTATTVIIIIAGYFILQRENPTLDPAGAFTIGALVAFANLTARFFAPISQLVALYNDFQSGSAAVAKLRDLLDTEPTVKERPDARPLEAMQGAIDIDHVSFAYDTGGPVLDDINLSIAAGETVSFVGPTGAGKSTLAKLIARFHEPTAGTIRIDGCDVREVTLDSLHGQLGVVPQEPFLFHGTIADNIRFARPDADDAEVRAACDAVGIGDLIERLPDGIDTPCHERGASLSSGERQLLALARAFIARPRVLILDEATSNIDQQSEAAVERALDVLLDGRTAIIIAHRLATAMRADRIAVIADQGILELGSHDELVARGGYYAEMVSTWQQHQA